jgi:hypothetical protein
MSDQQLRRPGVGGPVVMEEIVQSFEFAVNAQAFFV